MDLNVDLMYLYCIAVGGLFDCHCSTVVTSKMCRIISWFRDKPFWVTEPIPDGLA
jgi:hypothetical protein